MKHTRMIVPLSLLLLLAVHAHAQEKEVLERASRYEPYIVESSRRYGVDPNLLWTIAYLETRFQPWQVSSKGARGLMQIMPPTAARFGLKDPFNARESIDVAARYVRDLQQIFGNRSELILAAYNAGEGAVEAFRDGRTLVLQNGTVINPRGIRTGGIPPYLETCKYVTRGKTIYQNITRRTLFTEHQFSQGSGNTEGENGVDSENVPGESSIYILEPGGEHPPVKKLKPQKSKAAVQPANSIYAK